MPSKIIQVSITRRFEQKLNLYVYAIFYTLQVLSETLGYMSTRDRRGPLTISMLFCLGEWAMQLGPDVLLRVFQGKPLLMTLFTVSGALNLPKRIKLVNF